MKLSKYIVIFLLIFSYTYSKNHINYLDPVPDAKYINVNNNIVIGIDNKIDLSEKDILKYITVNGSLSGMHKGSVSLIENGKRIIFKLSDMFNLREKVTVSLSSKLMNKISDENRDYNYSFYTSARYQADVSKLSNDMNVNNEYNNGKDVLPPNLTVIINNNPCPGYIFLAPFSSATYLSIYDINGSPYYNLAIPTGGDFKLQPNGHRTYFDGTKWKHFEVDEAGNKVDTFYCGNGYITDIHELRVLSNGYALVMAYDTQVVNMSTIVQGGDTAALVVGTIYQKIDPDNNVVFQWRSWDHYDITDALHENLLLHHIDAVHGNAIELDNDGNLLVSSRHLDEITKINIITGDILWRFGGLHNQFTYLNDSIPFHYQHAVRRISNGNITLYDNGNFHTPPYSRAAEYHLDEVNKTAELKWQYVNNPIVFGTWGGYVQRLENGNTLISWGGASPTITEVDSLKNIVFLAMYPNGVFTYRGYKFPTTGIITNVENGSGELPESFSLKQNYPNPFNPSTKIEYSISKAVFAELSVFDITGREVKKIVSEYKQPGSYTVSFDGSQLSSGIYIYRLKAGDYTTSRKMILMK